MSYADFLARKKSRASRTGLSVTDTHPFLHDWQAELVRWAASIGRAASRVGQTKLIELANEDAS